VLPETVIAFTPTTKILSCGKCGRDMTVSIRTVLAYCPACSAGLGGMGAELLREGKMDHINTDTPAAPTKMNTTPSSGQNGAVQILQHRVTVTTAVEGFNSSLVRSSSLLLT
jgi:hypothetical protein